MGIREALEKRPALGWGTAAVLSVIAVLLMLRNFGGGETAQLTQEITIRCRETGKEWKMVRGAMERQLNLRPFPVNPDEGLINPDTGKPTGFPVDDWRLTIDRINALRKPLAEKNAAKNPPKAPPGTP